MKIGIVGALQREVELLLQVMELEKEETFGMREYYSGKLFGHDVVMVFSKCGKVAAATAITALIERYGVGMIIFTGVAGAADSTLNIGDIVIAEGLIQHDYDISLLSIRDLDPTVIGRNKFWTNKYLSGQLNAAAEAYINETMRGDVEAELLEEFNINTPKIVTGVVASGDQFIADKIKVKELSDRIDNLKCVEMEGAAAAQVCYEYGIKFMLFRIISDKADEHADFNFYKFVEKTASYFTRGIIKNVLSRLDMNADGINDKMTMS